MQGNIEKTAKNVCNYRKETIFYKSAREGFSEILKSLKNKYGDFTLLLPGFVGYSPNEGSGIYDPILENKIRHIFYPINQEINVIVKKYEEIISDISGCVVVLIVHYFGYVDPNIDKLVKIAKEKKAIIIEDCAHALYTDYIDEKCGRFSDISIYSLHKMLPYQSGGMVRINNNTIQLKNTNYFYNIIEYNLKEISKKRKENAQIIEKELKDVKGIKILRPINKYRKQTPQTYPILIEEKDKNEMNHKLNLDGFGVVSLYHTMISTLKKEEYKTANEIGNKILNLPIHQDAEKEQLIKMCNIIKKMLGE